MKLSHVELFEHSRRERRVVPKRPNEIASKGCVNFHKGADLIQLPPQIIPSIQYCFLIMNLEKQFCSWVTQCN
jgi:hypothetical protein